MIFIDTGFLIALFEKSDALHDRALRWSSVNRSPLLVTEFVLLETFNRLSKPRQRPKIQIIQRTIAVDPKFELISLSSELFTAGCALHAERPDKAWSLTDCTSFVVMQRRGIVSALAHDHHFEQAGFEALLRCDP